MSSKLSSLKGTHDILPEDIAQWHFIEDTARTLCHQFDYSEIRTPIIEHTELFARGVGDSTDIVNKEMFTFEKSDRMISLRPENTAGVVRAFIEHGMSRRPKPVKLFYMGPMFRYERPQAGRQRQFHQLGVELFGVKTPQADAEVIQLAMSILSAIKLKDLTLEINTLGDSNSRDALLAIIREKTQADKTSLCPDCQRRFEQNPLRMLDCKVPSCQAIYQSKAIAEAMANELDAAPGGEDFQTLLGLLNDLGIAYTRNPQLVRGLDYYTNTVFEITTTQLGAQNAVCGGGRYDGLIEILGGPATPAIGWAMGLERLYSLLEKPTAPVPDYFIVSDNASQALILANTLRNKGYHVISDLAGRSPNKQWDVAIKSEARHIIELDTSTGTLKQKTRDNQSTPLTTTVSEFCQSL